MRAVPAVVPNALRADARRNREAILRVADEAFAEDCDEVSLHDIAQRTGLSRATVYRHFPDRKTLATAVAAQHLAAFERAAAAHHGDRRPFRELLQTVLSLQAARRPLVRVFRELPARHQLQYTAALIRVLRPAFDEAQREGSLRDDVEPTDLALVFEMLEAALAGGPATMDRTEPTQRLVQVLLDGLFVPCAAQGS
jgi:AcrR family transcriptional regulator